MKKLASLVLALCLAFTLAVPALAAGDVVWSKDTTLTSFINRYDNATVKAGVTLTMKEFKPDPQGLEIAKSLAVETGGKISGGSIIFAHGATCSGLDLYYIVMGEEKQLPGGTTIADVEALFSNVPDFSAHFTYNYTTGHFVLNGEGFEGDPFAPPPSPDGGNNASAVDERTIAFAEGLKALGLFQGSDKGFELERRPTRVEALVLLIRLLGKDAEAKAYDAAKCPFDDVDSWARGYVAYAYDNALTKGVSDTKFNPANNANATLQQFETFVLRAMGYSDENGADFTWDHPEALAENLGIVLGPNDDVNFSRGTCVRIMEIALRNAMKDGTPLYMKLVNDGVFTEEQYKAAMQ